VTIKLLVDGSSEDQQDLDELELLS